MRSSVLACLSLLLAQRMPAGDHRQVEPTLHAGGRRADRWNGIHQAHRCADATIDVVVVALEVDLQVAAHRGHPFNGDAVRPRPAALWPVRGDVVAQARDMLDEDRRLAADDPRDLEVNAGNRSLLDASRASTGKGSWSPRRSVGVSVHRRVSHMRVRVARLVT